MDENLISNENLEDFILSLSRKPDNDFFELKEYAKVNDVPIIRDSTKNLIKLIINIKKPKEILEVGTAIAYSSLIMASVDKNIKITTIEDFERRQQEAEKNISKYDKYNQITLIKDDATNFFNDNKDKKELYDIVFLDAAKGQYINWLPYIKRLMKKDSILIADNIFKDGEILESKFAIKKRNRTIHKRMREYLNSIFNDEELKSFTLNIEDGVAVSIKNV